MGVTIVNLGETVVAGDGYTIELVLDKEGVVDPNYLANSPTISASIWPGGVAGFAITDKLVTVIDAGLGRANLVLTEADTLLLAPNLPNYARKFVTQYGDIKVIEDPGGRVSHNGPFKFPVRRKITG